MMSQITVAIWLTSLACRIHPMINHDEYIEWQSPDFGYAVLFEIMDAVWIFVDSVSDTH